MINKYSKLFLIATILSGACIKEAYAVREFQFQSRVRFGEKMLLHEAVKDRDIDRVKNLVEFFGSDFDAIDEYGRTPLHYAFMVGSSVGEYDIAIFLIKSGANCRIEDDFGKIPNHYINLDVNLDLASLLSILD